MEIRDVSFRCAALAATDRPREWFPQVAVAGRSNVGKSSLLNWLCRQRLARVAKAPGKTRTLNFYLVNRSMFLVDLPGYGYAKVALGLREQWGRELGRYLAQEERLAGVMTLVDIRHGPTALDNQLHDLLQHRGLPRMVILTKADKVGRGACARMRQQVQRQLVLASPPLSASVHTGQGRREILEQLDHLVTAWREQHQRRD